MQSKKEKKRINLFRGYFARRDSNDYLRDFFGGIHSIRLEYAIINASLTCHSTSHSMKFIVLERGVASKIPVQELQKLRERVVFAQRFTTKSHNVQPPWRNFFCLFPGLVSIKRFADARLSQL